MANINKVMLIGRLTRDPQTRHIQSGTSVTEFGLAVNRSYTVNGEKREEVLFVDVSAWAKAGETIERYVKKGEQLYVEGRLKLDTWDDKDTGAKRSKLSVVVDQFQFLGGSGDGSERQQSGGSRRRDEIRPDDFGVGGDVPHGGGTPDDVPF